jgi:hypothetical protein
LNVTVSKGDNVKLNVREKVWSGAVPELIVLDAARDDPAVPNKNENDATPLPLPVVVTDRPSEPLIDKTT